MNGIESANPCVTVGKRNTPGRRELTRRTPKFDDQLRDNETWCTGFYNDNFRKPGRLEGNEIGERTPTPDWVSESSTRTADSARLMPTAGTLRTAMAAYGRCRMRLTGAPTGT